MKYLSLLAITIFFCNSTFCQNKDKAPSENYFGVSIEQSQRNLGVLSTNSNAIMISIKSILSLRNKSYFAIDIGKRNYQFIEKKQNVSDLQSEYEMFYRARILYSYFLFYFTGSASRYHVIGSVDNSSLINNPILTKNNYTINEFPVGIGANIYLLGIKINAGVNKTFFYGSNQSELLINNLSYGKQTTTFIDQTPISLSGELNVFIAGKYNLEFRLESYTNMDYVVQFGIYFSENKR